MATIWPGSLAAPGNARCCWSLSGPPGPTAAEEQLTPTTPFKAAPIPKGAGPAVSGRRAASRGGSAASVQAPVRITDVHMA